MARPSMLHFCSTSWLDMIAVLVMLCTYALGKGSCNALHFYNFFDFLHFYEGPMAYECHLLLPNS